VCFSASAQNPTKQHIKKLNNIYSFINDNYVDDVDIEPLVEEAIRATLKELDPHSRYITREEMEELRNRSLGHFAGIGIKYMLHNDTIVVRKTMDNSPASKAGILTNDRIVAIDGHSIVGDTSLNISTLLNGEVGSKVMVEVVRRGVAEPLIFTLKRDNIFNSAITAGYRIGDVGYIAISNFSRPLAAEFYSAINSLGDIRCIVIDLRDNGGGALTAAIDLSSLFLNKGDVIVTTEGRSKKMTHYKRRDDKPFDLPLVILVNENSASASELFAGAMQDHDRGIIIGRTTYGKGLVQRKINLQDGSGVAITIARYKTPSGRIIQRPYEMGKGGEYMADSTRYIHPDSLNLDNRPVYTTLNKGRKVYGGGGITPDIYIPKQEITLSECVAEARRNNIFTHCIIDYCDIVDIYAVGEQYPTFEDFEKNYTTDSLATEIFYNLAGITNEDTTPSDREYIAIMLKALIADRLYGYDAWHYIYCKHYDYMMQQAISIIQENKMIL
jgi:carboxyl-terminal processing protease